MQDMVIYELLSADILEGLDALDGEVEKKMLCSTLFYNLRGANQVG